MTFPGNGKPAGLATEIVRGSTGQVMPARSAVAEVGITAGIDVRSFLISENGARRCSGVFALASALIVAEDKGLILLDGPPDRASELVELKRWLLRSWDIEEVMCVEHVIAEKLKCIAMPLIRASLGGRVDNAAGTPVHTAR